MNKKILSLLFASLLLVLGACSGDDTATNETPTDVNEETEAVETTNEEEKSESNDNEQDKLYEFNEVLLDDDELHVEITRVGEVYEDGEKAIAVGFDIENKTDRNLEVQSRLVSIDDRMVDESLIELSESIAGGKSADVALVIYSYDENISIPDLKNNLEMQLYVFDWDDNEYSKTIDVFVEF